MVEILQKFDANAIAEGFDIQRKNKLMLRTEPVSERKSRLLKIRSWIHQNRHLIHKAMYADFQKAALEVDAIELFHVLNEIKLALSSLDQWTKPTKVDAPLTMLGTRSFIQYEAKGICLIISPWNYPFSLAVGPLVSALAAGNSVILKPSELTPHVAELLTRMVKDLFQPHEVSIFTGGAEVAQALLEFPFDHIFFTGSTTVGKSVMKAAAVNLTAVTLELGGKSPVIVHEDTDIDQAAQRIAVAKFVNNGQTCIAPDYALVSKEILPQFLVALKQKTLQHFSDNGSFQTSKSYCRIVNRHHYNRLQDLLSDAMNRGAEIFWSGDMDPPSRLFHPVVLTRVARESKVLTEEIFGPILPVIEYTDINEAIEYINHYDKPLALYLFSNSIKIQQQVLQGTSSGGVCINDCGIHFLNHNLPFGGVNHSGIGKSHGYFGFKSFSNQKPVLKQKNGITMVRLFYPPYTDRSKKIMDWFLKLF